MEYESERIEYKSQMIDDIYKEVIAFANTDGGVIYIGIDDKGNPTGIDNKASRLNESTPFFFFSQMPLDGENRL